MHLGQSELWEARHAIPGFTKLDELSQCSIGGNPRYKGSAQRVRDTVQPDKQRTRVTREREDSPQK